MSKNSKTFIVVILGLVAVWLLLGSPKIDLKGIVSGFSSKIESIGASVDDVDYEEPTAVPVRKVKVNPVVPTAADIQPEMQIEEPVDNSVPEPTSDQPIPYNPVQDTSTDTNGVLDTNIP